MWSYFPERLCSCSRPAGSQGAGTFLSGLFLLAAETTEKFRFYYLHWSKDLSISHEQRSEVVKGVNISPFCELCCTHCLTGGWSCKIFSLFGKYLLLNKGYWKCTSAFYYQRFCSVWMKWRKDRSFEGFLDLENKWKNIFSHM